MNGKIKVFIVLLLCFVLFGCSGKEVPKGNQTLEILPVSNGYIAEVVSFNAETFDGKTTDDISNPANSYLPIGTVDYCAESSVINNSVKKEYRLLRCGKRTYEHAVKVYKGNLPKNNKIIADSFSDDKKYTVLSLISDFKAPFFVEFRDKNLTKLTDFKIEKNTAAYLDITFCYCNEFINDFTFEDNYLFESYESIKGENNTVLRFKLKNIGSFYGWYAEYDEEDYLNFYFLKPTKVYSFNNRYGYAIPDATIVIDAGHGGIDSGAVGGGLKESDINLSFSKILANKFGEVGATVVLTRDGFDEPGAQNRILTAFAHKPDMVISIHRNAGSGNGFGSYYYNSYSFDAANEIYKATKNSSLYRNYHKTNFHYFFFNRISFCPAVLTENGYITNSGDRENMTSLFHMEKSAEAIVKGVINFYINTPNIE